MSTSSDTPIPPELQALLRQVQEALERVPPEQRAQAALSVAQQLAQVAAAYQQLTASLPDVFERIGKGMRD